MNDPYSGRPSRSSQYSQRTSSRRSSQEETRSRASSRDRNAREDSTRRARGTQPSQQMRPTDSRRSSQRHYSRNTQSSRSTSSYNRPDVWSKNPKKPTGFLAVLAGVFLFLGRALWTGLRYAASGILFVLKALFRLLSTSRIALAVFLVLVATTSVGVADYVVNKDKVYAGVSVGGIDVSGLTEQEIEVLINETYAESFALADAVIYASDEAEEQVNDEVLAAQDAAQAEQLAVEEAQAYKLAWSTDVASLEATIPTSEIAQEALAVGRDDGGLLTRLSAFLFGYEVEMRASYSETLLAALIDDIDATIGEERKDYNIEIVDGVAEVTEGYDGCLIDQDVFIAALDAIFFAGEDADNTFVAIAEYAPIRITEEQASEVATQINNAISDGVSFIYEGRIWDASASEVGTWITTSIDEDGDTYVLTASVNADAAKPSLLTSVNAIESDTSIQVTFEQVDDEILVHTDGAGIIPLVDDAVSLLNEAFFGEEGKASGSSELYPSGSTIEIYVESTATPTDLTFDEALELGIIGEISTYTTEYSTSSGSENRNHNIELISSVINNSIIAAGESWSFNDTTGERTEEQGYLPAGAIIDGEYDNSTVGGGICQVATTIFDAVYESGLPVLARYNHTLYIASYPLGLDAAVSWPDLDLVWENDTTSDVLMQVTCGDGTVTATLYGVDLGYEVTTETGELREGESYSTTTEIDESLAPGTSYVKTVGTNGSEITIVRTVTDSDGTLIRQDSFYSLYYPVDEVIVEGPEVSS